MSPLHHLSARAIALYRKVAVGSTVAVIALMGAPAARAAAAPVFAPATTADTASSTDWSGWDVTGGTSSAVAASWTVPAVTCTAGETSYSADWVGLDGDGSDSVEQIGTSSDCDGGTPVYSSWYEFYPSASVSLASRVRPGDRVSASVTAVPHSDDFTLRLTDTTGKWTVTRTAASPEGTGASAEIIAEAPSGSEQYDSVLPLADFHRVTFTGVTVDGKPLGSVGGARRIAMVDDSGAPMATVSGVTSGSFGVTWVSSGDTGTGSVGRGRSGDSDGWTPGDLAGGWGSGDGYPDGWGSGGDTRGSGSVGGFDGWGSGGDTGGWGYPGGSGDFGGWLGTGGWGGTGYPDGSGDAGGWGSYWAS